MDLTDKYLTEGYIGKELDKIDYNAPTVNVQIRDYDGNKTKWIGLNDKQAVGEFMKFIRNRANAF